MRQRGGRIRRLAYSDLPAVISIERRSFPTPWSLAMFVLELSKPSGICLAADDERRAARLPRLLALRPGLAPDERRRDAGAAPRGHRQPPDLPRSSRRREASCRSRSRCGSPTATAITMYEGLGFRSAVCAPAITKIMARTH